MSEQLKPEHLAYFPGPRIERYNADCRAFEEALAKRSGLLRVRVFPFDWPNDSYDQLEYILNTFRCYASVTVSGRKLGISEEVVRARYESLGVDVTVDWLLDNWAHKLAQTMLNTPEKGE